MDSHSMSSQVHEEQADDGALHLPTELLIAIVDHVETDADLLTLARTSRNFHTISLERYFRKYDFNPFSKSIEIHSSASREVLVGLGASLDVMGRSIQLLSYDSGFTQDPTKMMKEIRLLTNYISKLSCIQCASLHVGINRLGLEKERQELCLVFLNTILAKRCDDVSIFASQSLLMNTEPQNIPNRSAPPEWTRRYWPAGHEPPKEQHLKNGFVHGFPRFLRPFYYHTFRTNSMTITNLSFRNIFEGGTDWAAMLVYLFFPHLRNFVLVNSIIPRDPFVKFLAKHQGTISEFRYQNVQYVPVPESPALSDDLVPTFRYTLEKLMTAPEHINSLMPSFASLSRLKYVLINIEEVPNRFDEVEDALRRLAGCTNKITLDIRVVVPDRPQVGMGMGIGTWLRKIFAPPVDISAASRPERNLRCVENLLIDNGAAGFGGDSIVTHLPGWIRLFPELKDLTLLVIPPRSYFRYGAPFPFSMEDNILPNQSNFVEAIKTSYPGLSVRFKVRDS
ncbi:hypothetical protein BDN70DRAFT_870599 [Pholiota conissans]|uniref:F-box domain-containing protein n=1 Tax=Pholiota conissans TaxID=109636 RepID=A0A9P6D6Z5_9AGAR|nr:hypothetical protein BDN70DRAFT_870599 [Pholiota conissans]